MIDSPRSIFSARTVQVDNGSADVDAELSGVITGGSGGTLTKTGTGTLELQGSNGYGGATLISAGTLKIATFTNGGAASTLGSSSNAAANLVINGGTLQYTGATTTTDRLFSVGTATGSVIDELIANPWTPYAAGTLVALLALLGWARSRSCTRCASR